MTTNDRIVLDSHLAQKKKDIDPQVTDEVFFEYFAAEQILKDFDLSYDEIDSGIMGGGGDGGVDAGYILINGTLVQEDSQLDQLKQDLVIDLIIIQAKTGTGFQEAPINKFIMLSKHLFDLSLDISGLASIYNVRTFSFLELFHKSYKQLSSTLPTLKVSFYYASKGKEPHPDTLKRAKMLEQEVKSLFMDACFTFEFLGAAELISLARRHPQTTYNLPLAENPISSAHSGGFVCLVRLQDFYKFITDEHANLRKQAFESNVRDYQGTTQVNSDIQASLKEDMSEDFWWLNNGMSILGSRVSLGGKVLTIEDPQIVNGLQTATEIHKYFRTGPPEGETRNVLVRIMVPPEEASRDRIIKATNSQTVVQAASLRATDKVQQDIEDYLNSRGLFYDRRKNYYKNEGKPRDKIVGIPYLAQAVMAIVLRRPDDARARPSSLLTNDQDYDQVFDPSHSMGMYYVCAAAMKKIEVFMKGSTQNISTKDRNNLKFYVAMHAIAGTGPCDFASPSEIAEFDITVLNGQRIQKSLEVVEREYMRLGGDDRVAKGTQLLYCLLQGVDPSVL